MTLLKKHDNMPTVTKTCNNYVTNCNKNELIEHNIVKETCKQFVTNSGGYYEIWEKERDCKFSTCRLFVA